MMKKRSTFCLLATALLVGNAATAADLPSYLPAAPIADPVAQTFNWTGFYVGGHGGYSWGRDRTSEYLNGNSVLVGGPFKFHANGVFGGIHAGGNFQYGSLVAGIEADADAAGARGGFRDAPNLALFNPGGVVRMRINGQGSLRGRLGFALDRLLIYGTGGLALADIRYSYNNPTTGVTDKTSRVRSGYTIGGGLEYAVTDNLTSSIEYRYTDFGKFKYTSTAAFLGVFGRQQPRSNSVRVGLGYKF